MKRKYLICLITLIFIIAVSISSVSAEDSDISNVTAVSDEIDVDMDESAEEIDVDTDELLDRNINDASNFQTVDSGNVSGGVYIAEDDHLFTTYSSFTYDVPSNATIKKAYLHANVYSGSAQPTYAANAEIYMNGNLFREENLVCTQGSTDGTVYTINANITKVYSDYDMRYDITDTISGLNGTTLTFEIGTSPINGYSFDGRIKWFALVVAYDDGDDDIIYYWIKSGQAWFNQPATTTFETSSISNPKNANLRNVVLSSSNPEFTLNGNSTVANNTASGNYYKYNEWYDISNYMPGSSNTVLGWVPGSGYYGSASMKTVLGVLTLEEEQYSSNNFNGLLGSCDLSDVLSVSSEEILADPDVNVITSGNFTYDWSYNTTINGDIDIFVAIMPNNNYNLRQYNNTNITIRLNDDETITESYLFLPISSPNANFVDNVYKYAIQFNGYNITDKLMHVYTTTVTTAIRHESLMIYNITGLIKANENNELYIEIPSTGSFTILHGEYIVTLYQKPGAPQKNVYFGNGANFLKTNGPNKVENEVNVTLDDVVDAKYYLFARNSPYNIINVEFNNNMFVPFRGDSSFQNTRYFETDVTNIIKESNNITIKAVDIGTNQNAWNKLLTQLIVTTTGELDVEVTNIATEYANTAYAGTNNVITATVDSTIPIDANNNLTIKLLADGVIVNESGVELTNGISTINLIDPTIRPVDEFTVYAADVTNKNVVYTVEIYDGDKLISTKNITVPIRYNGYLSKDYAYPTGDEPYTLNTTVSGGVLVDITESKYIGATGTGVNNRTDNFTLTLPANSAFVNGLLYVPYTADSTSAGYPVFNMTFNGADISDKILGKYRDKTNLGTGTYGKQYYGVLIYDVSGLIKDGNNTLVLIKANGTNVAVYPTILIGLYNTTNSTVQSDIYILNGADQLSKSSSNKAGRLVNLTSKVDLDIGRMQNAYWYVFESGGTSGRGDLIFNDKLYSNVWNGTDYNLVQYYVADVSDLIKDSNIASFVATGSGITALQQIIIVENALFDLNLPAELTTGETSSFTMDLPSDATGYVLLEVDGNKLFSEVTNGTATFNIPSLTAGDNIVKCTYLGDDKYKAMTVNSTIHVLAKPVLTAKDVTMLYTSNQYYSVKVTQDGKALTGKAVTFTVNGKAITANTDKNGVAKVKLSLNPGKYTVSASYGGIKVTNNVKVNSIIKASNKKVKKSAKKLKIKVSLKKVDGKFLKGKTLKLKINGKTLKAKTNKKGAATFTIKKNILKKLKAGKKYTYKVTYSKDTVSKKLTVKK